MVKFETLCNEILSALLFNYQCYLNTNDSNLEVQHEYLTQSAIISRLWDQVRDQSGYRNKDLLSRAFRDLEEKGWVINHSGKQNAKLYFPTEEGIKQGDSILNSKNKEIKCLVDGANVAYYPNREKPSLMNVVKVLKALQQKSYFGFRDVSMRVLMKPIIRHKISESEQELWHNLERQGILIQSSRGGGSIDDRQILSFMKDFQELGFDVWVVTNDQYKDHLTEFPWYKNHPKKIEFTIIDEVIQFNPPTAEENKIDQSGTMEEQIEAKIKPKSLEYIKVGHVPDPASSIRLSPEDFLTFTKSNNINKIFFASKKQGTGVRGPVTSQQYLWFLLEGKNYLLSLGILEYEEIPSIEQIIEDNYLIESAYITRKEDLLTWKQGKLDKKGWFNYDMFKKFRNILETGGRTNIGTRKELNDNFHQMSEKARAKYSNLAIEDFPRYEPYTFDELDFFVWLVAQANGWESYSALVDFWFNLIDMDMLIENTPFYREFLAYLATQSPKDVSHLVDKQKFRRQYLTQFANQCQTVSVPYFPKELQKALGEYRVALKTSSFDPQPEFTDIPLTLFQTAFYALSKENGWSYQELLDKLNEFYSRKYLEEKATENIIKDISKARIKWIEAFKKASPPIVHFLLNLNSEKIREVIEKLFEFASKPKALFE